MPDWSYHPLSRPLLFRLPPEQARDLTLGALGRLTRLPGGYGLIAAMGHMHPPPALQRHIGGICFPSPVGLSAELDVHHVATGALARFGCGFIEVGPITLNSVRPNEPLVRDVANQAILYPRMIASDGLIKLQAALARVRPLPAPVGARIIHQPGSLPGAITCEQQSVIDGLHGLVDFITLDVRASFGAGQWSPGAWHAHLQAICQRASPLPVWLCVALDQPEMTLEPMIAPAVELGIAGLWLGDDVCSGERRCVGPANHTMAVNLVRALRARWGDQLPICAAGGVTEPQQAYALLRAGAQLVQVQSGLVYGGPGLFKRINETVLAATRAEPLINPAPGFPLTWRGWLRPGWHWACLLGIGMVIGGLLAWLIAETRVLLPYDEAFVQLTREQMRTINGNLLPFMRHDRVTLAGTMLSIGILYSMLAWYGLRLHCHWAWRALLWSGSVGFASFFLFLGFGYFDPLHALVSLLLLPMFVLGMLGPHAASPEVLIPDWHNDRRWRNGLWGQAIFVGLGIGIIVGGLAIATIGTTSVFVHEDLAFMQITARELARTSSNLVPLIAHDRAGFGGALVADGLAVLCSALWGFRRGAAWLWWLFLWAGLPGFGATLYTHWAEGYTNWVHLAPLFVGIILFGIGLYLMYGYLVDDSARTKSAGV